MKRLDMPLTALNNALVARENRTRFVGLRMTPQEAQVIDDLVDETGLSMSDIIRQAVRLAYAPRFKRAKNPRRK
jgi:Arc/MetJ-type ribon-helix-helix transcriptional regulator